MGEHLYPNWKGDMVWKYCKDCKHILLGCVAEPCNSCIRAEKPNKQWGRPGFEPKNEEGRPDP